MSDLKKLREKLDALDDQLVDVLKARADVALEVRKVKDAAAQDTYSPTREMQIIERARNRVAGEALHPDSVEAVMRSVISITRSLVGTVTVAYLGPKSSLAYVAAEKQLGAEVNFQSCDNTKAVFEEVERGNATCGIVPLESSAEGLVATTFNMLMQSKLTIIGEVEVACMYSLLSSDSSSLTEIRRIYGNLHAFSDCREWLASNAPNAELIVTDAPIVALETTDSDLAPAALVSIQAGEDTDLTVLAKAICDEIRQTERFIVLGNSSPKPSGNDKTSLLCSVKERSGALLDVLKPIAEHDLTLTKIRSKAIRTNAWDFVFFLELIGHQDSPEVADAIREIEQNASYLKVLGSYPAGSSAS